MYIVKVKVNWGEKKRKSEAKTTLNLILKLFVFFKLKRLIVCFYTHIFFFYIHIHRMFKVHLRQKKKKINTNVYKSFHFNRGAPKTKNQIGLNRNTTIVQWLRSSVRLCGYLCVNRCHNRSRAIPDGHVHDKFCA